MATAARDLVPAKGTGKKLTGRGGPGRGQGRKDWQPLPQRREVPGNPGIFKEETQEQAWERARSEVRHYVAIGYPAEHICKLLNPPLSGNTLRKWFEYELEHGRLIQDAKVAGTAYWMATNGREPSMTRFWCRARLGWRDVGDQPSSGMDVRFQKIEGDDW